MSYLMLGNVGCLDNQSELRYIFIIYYFYFYFWFLMVFEGSKDFEGSEYVFLVLRVMSIVGWEGE